MDVIPHGLREVPEASYISRPTPRPSHAAAAVHAADTPVPVPTTAVETPEEKDAKRGFDASGSLKFSVRAADVDAKFEIHEATKKITVTMYDRETGEVLREFPSRHVLDAIASLTDSGLHVDTTS